MQKPAEKRLNLNIYDTEFKKIFAIYIKEAYNVG